MCGSQLVLEMLHAILKETHRNMCATLLNSRSGEFASHIREEIGHAQCHLSLCHMSLCEISKALLAAESAIRAHPRLAKAHAFRALALQGVGLPAWIAADIAVFVAEANREHSAAFE